MKRIPDCWRDCKDENYKKQILKIRDGLFIKLDEGSENIFRIRRLMFGGEIKKIQKSFVETGFILASCLGALTSSLSITCKDCEHRVEWENFNS